MRFENERELVKAYLEKCEKTKYCEITEQDLPCKNRFVEFILPGFGRIDLIDFSFGANPFDGILYGIVHILEFKNNSLCRDDVVQVNRYYQGIKNIIKDKFNIYDINQKKTSIHIGLYLIGSEANFNPDTMLLIDSIPELQIMTHKIVNGKIEIDFDPLKGVEYPADTNPVLDKHLTAAKYEWDNIRKAGGN